MQGFNHLVQSEFSHLGTYFDTANFGPTPLRAQKKVQEALEKELNPALIFEEWISIPKSIRQMLASLLNCSPFHIALSSSSSDMVSLVANGFPWREGDTVCALEGDYPCNVLPWMVAKSRHPFRFQLLKSDSSLPLTAFDLERLLPSSCRVLNLSWVAFDSGRRIDLSSIGALCRKRGIFFIVDATQGFGGLALSSRDLSLIDVLVCSTYKWLLGPYGGAFGYFSQRGIDLIQRQSGNWLVSPTLKDLNNLLDYTASPPEGACRFDRGQAPNMLGSAALGAALGLLKEIGLETIEAHNKSLCEAFVEGIPGGFEMVTPREQRGNIVCLTSKKDLPKLKKDLLAKGIKASVRQGRLRFSFHFFNTKEQVERCLEILERA